MLHTGTISYKFKMMLFVLLLFFSLCFCLFSLPEVSRADIFHSTDANVYAAHNFYKETKKPIVN